MNSCLLSRQEKMAPFLEPSPSSNETGELDSVLDRRFVIKDVDSSKAVMKLVDSPSNILTPELKLLTITAFRNACLHNELRKTVLEEAMNAAKIMDLWMYTATKNLEHLATTDESRVKNWYHATTDSFIVMEYLKLIWDCLRTEKKEQLFDKKTQLDALHEEHGLEWNQRNYLDEVSLTKLQNRNVDVEQYVSILY